MFSVKISQFPVNLGLKVNAIKVRQSYNNFINMHSIYNGSSNENLYETLITSILENPNPTRTKCLYAKQSLRATSSIPMVTNLIRLLRKQRYKHNGIQYDHKIVYELETLMILTPNQMCENCPK